MNVNRIQDCFSKLKTENKKALITFITAGHPDKKTSQDILNTLPESGADIIELGMPFTDPMADGPVIQNASLKALENGTTLKDVLAMVEAFRITNKTTPLILMGYFNPIYKYGIESFVKKAAAAGVDGFLIVDLPPEEDDELRIPAENAGLNVIKLVTPTTNEKRLPKVLAKASGFLYYVSITGVTGTKKADTGTVAKHIKQIKTHTDLPVAVGFGIRTTEDAAAMAQIADAIVVGSSIVETLDKVANQKADFDDVKTQVTALSNATHTARSKY